MHIKIKSQGNKVSFEKWKAPNSSSNIILIIETFSETVLSLITSAAWNNVFNTVTVSALHILPLRNNGEFSPELNSIYYY